MEGNTGHMETTLKTLWHTMNRGIIQATVSMDSIVYEGHEINEKKPSQALHHDVIRVLIFVQSNVSASIPGDSRSWEFPQSLPALSIGSFE